MTKEEILSALNSDDALRESVITEFSENDQLDLSELGFEQLPDNSPLKQYVIKLRNEAKDNRKDKERAERERLENEKKYKELYEKAISELDGIKPEVENWKTKYEGLENSLRQDLILKIPEAKREKYKNVEIGVLKEVAKDFEEFAKVRDNSDGSEDNSNGDQLLNMDIDQMNAEQLQKFKTNYPDKYREALRKRANAGISFNRI